MKASSKVLLTLSLCGILSACNTVSVKPGAENVVAGMGSAPKGCQFRGEVYSKDIDTAGLSHSYIQNKQMISLRNQAADKGANAVFITAHKAHYRNLFIASQGRFANDVNKHEVSGKAYSCSPAALSAIKPFVPESN